MLFTVLVLGPWKKRKWFKLLELRSPLQELKESSWAVGPPINIV